MSGLLDVLNKCTEDLASMSEYERHYTERKGPLTTHLRDGEQPARLPSSWHEDMSRMALTTIALALACEADATLDESPDCVPKGEGASPSDARDPREEAGFSPQGDPHPSGSGVLPRKTTWCNHCRRYITMPQGKRDCGNCGRRVR